MTATSSLDTLSRLATSTGIPEIDFQPRTRLVFGVGAIEKLGRLVRESGGTRVLVVTDTGIRAAGHLARAEESLRAAGLHASVFDDVPENPTTRDVDRCSGFAKSERIDFIVGLGGGSSMDCAKGANFLVSNGGRMHDYKGVGKATQPMLPMIAVPTTSGTGSEAQSFAVIADADSHLKMACGDPKAACRIAILDPELTVTMPRAVAAATGIDAMTHAIESYVTTKRNPISQMFARKAWVLLASSFPVVLREPMDLEARGRMQLGAYLAGAAIENSMLGAAHAAANPLTAQFHVTHGCAVGLLMPHVIRWNADHVDRLYLDLIESVHWMAERRDPADAANRLASGFVEFLRLADLPVSLSQAVESDLSAQVLSKLAVDAAQQWTGTFNPRKMDVMSFEALYRSAL